MSQVLIPISIKYSDLEEMCYFDKYEGGVICDDLNTTIEMTPEEVEFEREDLEQIVDEYFDEIIDILLSDKRYRDKILRRLLYP